MAKVSAYNNTTSCSRDVNIMLLFQIVSAVHYCHLKNIVHRDLKVNLYHLYTFFYYLWSFRKTVMTCHYNIWTLFNYYLLLMNRILSYTSNLRQKISCLMPTPTSRLLTLASVMSSLWAANWTHSAAVHRMPRQSSFRGRSMTGPRWTSGVWGWFSTHWSADHCPSMDRTSRCILRGPCESV